MQIHLRYRYRLYQYGEIMLQVTILLKCMGKMFNFINPVRNEQEKSRVKSQFAQSLLEHATM